MMTIEQYYLSKLAEEASEIAQIALKASQFGLEERQMPEGDTNGQRTHVEIDDLLAVIEELNRYCKFAFEPCDYRIENKKRKMRKWLAYSIELGKVEFNDEQ